ncbi:MAG TPA: helix-turn-helix domain-containing protein [Herpetosiphonaceae bacterium]|nr:helix-turn-helix domain-containing protein [Herpetosiphonaceae bacterium]
MIEIDGRNYLTVQEVCARLGVKPATIYAYVSRGILRSYRQGIKRQRLYREDAVDALLTLHLGSGISDRAEAPDRAKPSMEPEILDDRDDKLPAADGWMGEM